MNNFKMMDLVEFCYTVTDKQLKDENNPKQIQLMEGVVLFVLDGMSKTEDDMYRERFAKAILHWDIDELKTIINMFKRKVDTI